MLVNVTSMSLTAVSVGKRVLFADYREYERMSKSNIGKEVFNSPPSVFRCYEPS